jgi:hypothetical protein
MVVRVFPKEWLIREVLLTVLVQQTQQACSSLFKESSSFVSQHETKELRTVLPIRRNVTKIINEVLFIMRKKSIKIIYPSA